METKVSVILPTLNRAYLLSSSIKSVLNQSFQNFELIIIDDGSTDNTQEVARQFKDERIKYIKNGKNLGIQKSLNIGLKMAQGKYIARIDDDVEWIDKDKLKRQVEFLENFPEYVLVGTWAIVEKKRKLIKWRLPRGDNEIRKKILSKCCFIHSSVVFRREAALKLNGYDESSFTRHVEDYDFWLRMGQVGKFANLPIYGVKFIELKNTVSKSNKLEQLKKSLYLAKKYKNYYPNYWQGLFWHYLKILLLGYLKLEI